MTNYIDNTQDIIDIRDIIERVEELEELHYSKIIHPLIQATKLTDIVNETVINLGPFLKWSL